jgi:hypothetical protein
MKSIKVRKPFSLSQYLVVSSRRRPLAGLPKSGTASRFGMALDSVLMPFFPKWAANRLQARLNYQAAQIRYEATQSLASWAGADVSSDRIWKNELISPDSALDNDLEQLQMNCAELARDNCIAHSAIEGRVTHEIGIGLTPQAMVIPRASMGPRSIDRGSAASVSYVAVRAVEAFCENLGRVSKGKHRQH